VRYEARQAHLSGNFQVSECALLMYFVIGHVLISFM
jgi:hypothetical protein